MGHPMLFESTSIAWKTNTWWWLYTPTRHNMWWSRHKGKFLWAWWWESKCPRWWWWHSWRSQPIWGLTPHGHPNVGEDGRWWWPPPSQRWRRQSRVGNILMITPRCIDLMPSWWLWRCRGWLMWWWWTTWWYWVINNILSLHLWCGLDGCCGIKTWA